MSRCGGLVFTGLKRLVAVNTGGIKRKRKTYLKLGALTWVVPLSKTIVVISIMEERLGVGIITGGGGDQHCCCRWG